VLYLVFISVSSVSMWFNCFLFAATASLIAAEMAIIVNAAVRSRLVAVCMANRRRFPCFPPHGVVILAALLVFPACTVGGSFAHCRPLIF
jgi:hypothetical protein